MACGCGKPKPCPDGSCPHSKRPLTTRLIPFAIWAQSYTPVIPKFYWDVFSPEEGILNLVRELDRLRAYINYMFCEVEKLANELDEALTAAEELADQLAEKLTQAEQLLTELRTQISTITNEIETLREDVSDVRHMAYAADGKAEAAFANALAADNKAEVAKAIATEAQQAAYSAAEQAAEADIKATNAETSANAAREIAESLIESIRETQDEVEDLTQRIVNLEACCEDVKESLADLDTWKSEVDKQLEGLAIATAENPSVSLSNFECSGQVSSGPISGGGQSIYCSTLAFDVPLNHAARTIDVEYLGITARVGGNVAYEANDGNKVSLSGIDLIDNGVPVIPEIVDFNFALSRAGVRVRIQFSKPLWQQGTKPDGSYMQDRLMNATPVAYAVWMRASVR